jgi:glycerol-3-phosphate cytidylyltransferase-like family protein
MSAYNLNDNVSDSFEFILGGFTYKMRYPTVEETEQVQEVLKKAEKDGDSSIILEQMYQFISCEDEKAPKIDEALKKQTLPVIKNFNEMIKAEFSAS